MHSLNPPITHCDVKSPNVMLCSLNPNESAVCAKLGDFGSAVVMNFPTLSGGYVDNPIWFAPEILIQCSYNQTVMYNIINQQKFWWN